MLIKNTLAGIVRNVRGASCIAFAGLLALTSASSARADGLPYGGNVTAKISDGNLVIKGDNNSNLIRVSDASEYGGTPGDIVVWGGGRFLEAGIPQAPEGEYSLVNGSPDPVFLTGFNGNVRINTHSGADTLSFDLLECDDATVKFGACPQGAITTLSSNSLIVSGNFRVEKENGGKVAATIASSEIHGNLSIDGGAQNDPSETFLSGFYLSQLAVDGNVSIEGGGQDVLVELSTIGGSVFVETDNYQSSVVLDQLTIDGSVLVDLGGLDDSCRLQTLDVNGSVAVDTGAGNDTALLDAVSALGIAYIDLGSEDDGVEVTNSTIWGILWLDGGSGTDSSVIDATTYIYAVVQGMETTTP